MKKQMKSLMAISKTGIFAIFIGLILVGCESDDIPSGSNGTAETGEVTVQFKTTSSSSTNRPTAPFANGELMIEGMNGTLYIDDVRFIVDDFELEKEENDGNDADNGMDTDDDEFEDGLFFVDLPLDGQPLELATSDIQTGTYSSFEFEIDDLDMDEEEDTAEQQEKEALLAQIQTEFPDWPESASMLISGKFVSSTDGVETPFVVYAEAEINIEKTLDPALLISDSSTSSTLSVNIAPANWFETSDGSVINLSEFDYASTSQLLEFEVEMEDGFETVEVEED